MGPARTYLGRLAVVSKNAGHHTGHQKRPRQRVSATVKLLISLETGVNLGPSVGTSGSPGHQLTPYKFKKSNENRVMSSVWDHFWDRF